MAATEAERLRKVDFGLSVNRRRTRRKARARDIRHDFNETREYELRFARHATRVDVDVDDGDDIDVDNNNSNNNRDNSDDYNRSVRWLWRSNDASSTL